MSKTIPFYRPTIWRIALLLSAMVLIALQLYPLGIGADYLNHLARAYIETAIDRSAELQQYYTVSYNFVPNFTMEYLVPRLSPLFGIYQSGALVAGLAMVLPPLAGVAISRAIHGGDSGWLALLGFITVFNRSLEFGFINFLFGLGLGLFVFALWMRLEPGWRRTAIVAALGLVVAANHILGFLFLGYIFVLWESAHYAFGKRGTWKAFVPTLMIRDGLAFAPGLLVIIYAFFTASDVSTWSGDVARFGQRLPALLSGVGYFYSPLAGLAASAGIALLLAGLYFGIRNRVVIVHKEMAVVAAGVFLLVLVMPVHLDGIWGLHQRYAGAMIIMSAAAIRFRVEVTAPLAAGVIAVLGAALMTNGVAHLARVDAVHSDVRSAMATLPAGPRLIMTASPAVGFDVGVHSVSLAVIEADGYVPNLFTNISAVDVAPAMRSLHHPQGKPQSVGTLRQAAQQTLPAAANGRWSEQFYHGWPAHYSHLLYMRAPGEELEELPGLKLISEGRDFALYEISPP